MKRTIDEHAARFDAKAAAYDDRDRPVYRTCADLVIDLAAPGPMDTVLDLGTGTGAIALPLAGTAERVIGRDISESMLDRAREKAAAAGIENVSFGGGGLRDPGVDEPVEIVTSNYAMHHLDDVGKREAIAAVARFRPDRFVLGDVMLFAGADPDEPAFDPEVDDPATVGTLAHAMTDSGFELTRIEPVTDQAGVIVAESPRAGWPT